MKAPINFTQPEHYMTGGTMILVNLFHQEEKKENKYSFEQIIKAGGVLQWHLHHYNRHTTLNDSISELEIKKVPETF